MEEAGGTCKSKYTHSVPAVGALASHYYYGNQERGKQRTNEPLPKEGSWTPGNPWLDLWSSRGALATFPEADGLPVNRDKWTEMKVIITRGSEAATTAA